MDTDTLVRSSFVDSVLESTLINPLETVASQPLATIETYCQSKAFSANSGVNPLAAAASPLFSLVTKLAKTESYVDINVLQQNLVHEIRAFECGAHTHGYRPDQILIARYAICATLDEIIENTVWGNQNWQVYSLLQCFQGENNGGEAFFLLLEKLSKEPSQHIDLLEFMYLCLSLGFGGKFRHTVAGREELDKVIDDLYQIIRMVRKETSSALSAPYKFFQKILIKKTFPISISMVMVMAGTLLLVLYAGFNYLLSLTSAPLYSKLNSIVMTINHEITNS